MLYSARITERFRFIYSANFPDEQTNSSLDINCLQYRMKIIFKGNVLFFVRKELKNKSMAKTIFSPALEILLTFELSKVR